METERQTFFFLKVFDDVLQKPQSKRTLSMLPELLLFLLSPYTISTQTSSDGRIREGEAKSEVFRPTPVYVLLRNLPPSTFSQTESHTRSRFNRSTFHFLIKIFFIRTKMECDISMRHVFSDIPQVALIFFCLKSRLCPSVKTKNMLIDPKKIFFFS